MVENDATLKVSSKPKLRTGNSSTVNAVKSGPSGGSIHNFLADQEKLFLSLKLQIFLHSEFAKNFIERERKKHEETISNFFNSSLNIQKMKIYAPPSYA
ncbi:hypothetical protein CEXT_733671 [Caerostris extrusa]|uniref:Uncharacterized protein n=1 Tax=Caerostris extrusa TaxID=172846 RepID=A0AAV4RA11_CAEEX|nr:hypothetical protein CEXT_733671 [Caerostris extrusa]